LIYNPVANAQNKVPEFSSLGLPFLQKNCLSCHSGVKPKAELSLDVYKDSASLIKNRKVWDNVVKNIISGEMPPKDKPRPTVKESENFISLVQSIFDFNDRNAKPNPGNVTVRRLNRVEYKNTVRDLIGIDFDPTDDFPSDDIGHGFDNIGDVLTLSPVLMERYLSAAETIMSRAIVPDPTPVIKRHLSSRYTEPSLSDQAAAKIIEGQFRRMESDSKENNLSGPLHTSYMWENDGEYVFRSKVYANSVDSKPVRLAVLISDKNGPSKSLDSELELLVGNFPKNSLILKTFEIKADKPANAEVIEVKIPAMKGREKVLIALYKGMPDKVGNKAFVQYMALEGPLDSRPTSHRELLLVDAEKSKDIQTREVISRFLFKAFRRPPSPDEIQRSIALVNKAIKNGEKWESAMQFAMQAALCSPKFLFKLEIDGKPNNAEVRKLDDFQLASRLSYFIWSSMPDQILFDLASKKQLGTNLDKQVVRMLQDSKSSALVQNFALQWLQIKRLDLVSPDIKLFPSFDLRLRSAMKTETELFFSSVIKEDRSILDLIDSDYTFLNETLAKHYGIADTKGNMIGKKITQPGGLPIKGDEFLRVALSDKSRGGLLTQASILTATSNPTRTSPVKRGRWVLEQILGSPPPPPPPDVPELSADDKSVAQGSLRQRMEQHRKNPSCANCHAKMDPIGFALENFNAIGVFRAKDGNFDIDASGEFSDGTTFNGPADLKNIVKLKKDDFTRCLAEKMMIYALGRGLEYYDRPVIEKIVKYVSDNNYKFSSLVSAIVQSDAFQKSLKVEN
jgi:hypothetical protein